MSYYVEIIYVGPSRNKKSKIVSCTKKEFHTIQDHFMEIEDGDADENTRRLWCEVIARTEEKLALSDRAAIQAEKKLVSLEQR